MILKLGTIDEERLACEKRWEGYGIGALAHCCYHDQHFGILSIPVQNRIGCLGKKPIEEQALRYHSFSPWTGSLPSNLQQAHATAWQAHVSWMSTYSGVIDEQGYNAYQGACIFYEQALADWQATPEFIAEHARLFPDCAWNGESIFQGSENGAGENPLK